MTEKPEDFIYDPEFGEFLVVYKGIVIMKADEDEIRDPWEGTLVDQF